MRYLSLLLTKRKEYLTSCIVFCQFTDSTTTKISAPKANSSPTDYVSISRPHFIPKPGRNYGVTQFPLRGSSGILAAANGWRWHRMARLRVEGFGWNKSLAWFCTHCTTLPVRLIWEFEIWPNQYKSYYNRHRLYYDRIMFVFMSNGNWCNMHKTCRKTSVFFAISVRFRLRNLEGHTYVVRLDT